VLEDPRPGGVRLNAARLRYVSSGVTSRRTAALLALVLTALLSAAPAGTAAAHGAPTSPVSRAAECGGEGTRTGSAACRAALAKSPDLPTQWDNLRVAGVDGRDRQVIPDGALCSGGKPGFAGLDLPRDDWPTTTLEPGADFTFSYRGTIPHAGSFRLYLTRPGFAPDRPLTWSELETEPFADVTDPPFTDGSYSFDAKLPTGLTGRHLIYTIWQNSSSSDTYYSCSDVLFDAGAPPAPAPQAAAAPTPAPAPAPVTEPPATAEVTPAAQTQPTSGLPLIVAAVAVVAVGGALGALLLTRRRRR
jgi:predicted carbohydrate-binding protein with CBM5 and CBM33 domain